MKSAINCKSDDCLRDCYPEIKWGIKYARANVCFENNILTMPYSTAFLLRRVLT